MRGFKNRAEKFFGLIMVFVMVLSMTACDDTVENMPANGKVFIGEDDYTNITDDEETTEEDTEPESETEYTAPEISIVMVGDILLHDRVEKSALQEDGTYNYEPIFTYLKDDIQAAGLAIVNQEVIIGGEELGISGYPCFNASFTMADALARAGFDVVCHGTNHAMDKGKSGILNCISNWKEKYPEMAILGINENEEEYNDIFVYEQDGIKIAVLNYTYGTNGIALPDNMPYAVDLLDEQKVVSDIRKAEEIADFTIVCPHWGTEYVLEETDAQRRWAQIFLENGVDLVIGTHPHVIEPIEVLTDDNTGNQMLVYYSIGNFVNWTGEIGSGVSNRMVGGMAEVTLTRDENGKVVIKDYGVTALVSHLTEGTDGVTTMKLSEYTDELAAENKISEQDSNFSREYCINLCNKVWGELWK